MFILWPAAQEPCTAVAAWRQVTCHLQPEIHNHQQTQSAVSVSIVWAALTIAGRRISSKCCCGGQTTRGVSTRSALPSLQASSDDRCFKVAQLEGKGKGVLATRSLSPGELILAEKPLVAFESRVDLSYK